MPLNNNHDTVKNIATGDDNIDGLLATDRWKSKKITYGFPDDFREDYEVLYSDRSTRKTHRNSFSELNSTQKAVTREWLTMFEAVSQLNFEELTGRKQDDAIIRLAESDDPNTAYAYLPTDSVEGGDIWFNRIDFNAPLISNYAYHTFGHEIGHALGLKHGHERGGVRNLAMNSDRDSMEFSIMTYRSYIGAPGLAYEKWGAPQSLMMYDIRAIQEMYGANFEYNSSRTTYRFSPHTGEMFINDVGQGKPGANRIFRTIWDGNGFDTYDFSDYTTNLSINLAPGRWSDLAVGSDHQRAKLNKQVSGYTSGSFDYARGHVFNALQFKGDKRSLIESARGGSGNDKISGNVADNLLYGNGGNDTLRGGVGHDHLTGGSGRDRLFGGLGNDVLYGGIGRDYLNGGSGADWLLGGADDDYLAGWDGDDNLYGEKGNDNLYGGRGRDTLRGGDGNDVLYAQAQNPNVINAEGVDKTSNYLYGDAGDDILYGAHGNDQLFGGTGNDTVNGGEGNDTIKGESGNDRLYGNAGNDSIEGNAGNDYLSGSSGNDQLMGGNGDDFLGGWSGDDTLYGGDGADKLYGDSGQDSLYGGAGDDLLYAHTHNANAISRLGQDYSDNYLNGGEGNDQLFGARGNDQLVGGDGNDTLTGGRGDDSLYGGDGNDSLHGGSGADVLSSSSGDDLLRGDFGADVFFFGSLNQGTDIISDFDRSEGDKIQIKRVGFGASSIRDFSFDSSTGALSFRPVLADWVTPRHFATVQNTGDFSISTDVVLV